MGSGAFGIVWPTAKAIGTSLLKDPPTSRKQRIKAAANTTKGLKLKIITLIGSFILGVDHVLQPLGGLMLHGHAGRFVSHQLTQRTSEGHLKEDVDKNYAVFVHVVSVEPSVAHVGDHGPGFEREGPYNAS